jgi:hypothetical protein
MIADGGGLPKATGALRIAPDGSIALDDVNLHSHNKA